MLAFLLSIAEKSDHDKIIYVYEKFKTEMLILANGRLRAKGAKNTNDDALDIVQNSFFKITKYIKNIDFTRNEDEIRVYVLAIVENEVHNFLNDSLRLESLDKSMDLISDPNFFEQIRIKDMYDTVVSEIKRLDEKYSITMLYRYLDGMSVRQIADFMGVPQKTVYTRLERGKRLLVEAMKKYDL